MQSCLAESTTFLAIFHKSESRIENISPAPTLHTVRNRFWIQLSKKVGEARERTNILGPVKPTVEEAMDLAWTRTSLKIGLRKKWSRVHLMAYVLASLSLIPITTTFFSDCDTAISKTTTTQTNTTLFPSLLFNSFMFLSLPFTSFHKPCYLYTRLSIIESLLHHGTPV